MTKQSTNANHPPSTKLPSGTLERVNQSLQAYSDKDWNYSRIILITNTLEFSDSPYALGFEILDLNTKEGRAQLKALTDEIRWGERHSSELGMLEVVSLRINKALLEVSSDEYWQRARPVVRITKTEGVSKEALTNALWYQITEVAGEEFDNR